MNTFLTLAFLFFIGSVTGWGIELIFRRFVSTSNPERKWINPGFCTGPYLPLYGFGLCLLYLIASLEQWSPITHPVWRKTVLFLAMALCMTGIEYLAGALCLKLIKVRLWDYSDEWGNIQGIICPRFSAFWAILGAIYYFLIHPYILGALEWLSQNLAFSFVVGMFFGVLTVDVAYSAQLVAKLKRFAEENSVVVRYEHLKSHLRRIQDKNKQKLRFLLPFRTERPLSEYLKEYRASMEERIKQFKHKK